MPYIGKSPVGGGFHKLDNLTASATDTYALTLGSAAYYPETANQLLVSLNGVIQAPQDSFTVSGSNLVFDSALTASDSIDFVVALGDVLGVQGVTDGAITTAKIGNGAVTAAKIQASAVDLTSKVTGVLPVANGGNGLSALDYRSIVFPNDSTTMQNDITDSSIDSSLGNTITATLSSGTGGLGYNTDATLSGLTTGVYEFHMFASHDRTSNASVTDLRVQLLEGGTQIAQGISTSYTQKYVNTSLSIIRDYTSSVPASVVLRFDANRSNYPAIRGSGFVVKRIG